MRVGDLLAMPAAQQVSVTRGDEAIELRDQRFPLPPLPQADTTLSTPDMNYAFRPALVKHRMVSGGSETQGLGLFPYILREPALDLIDEYEASTWAAA